MKMKPKYKREKSYSDPIFDTANINFYDDSECPQYITFYFR